MIDNKAKKPAKLWGTLKSHHKIIAEHTAELPQTDRWDVDTLFDSLSEICTALDIARPVVLVKHAADMGKFSRAVFKKADFVERVKFDSFEVELLKDDEEKQSTVQTEDNRLWTT